MKTLFAGKQFAGYRNSVTSTEPFLHKICPLIKVMFQFVKHNPLCVYNTVHKKEHNTEKVAVSPMTEILELAYV
jgi:hypothetical protein